MHSFTVNCDTLSNVEKVAIVVLVTNAEETCSEAMFSMLEVLCFYASLVKCLMKILGRSVLG